MKHLFINKPTFAKYTDADEIYMKMLNIQLLDEQTRQKNCDLLQ